MTQCRLASLLFVFILASAPALAHVDPATGQDYQGFERRDGKGSCCNWLDCRPATAPFSTPEGERIRDRAGNLFRYDPAIVVARPSDDDNWHVCGNGTRLHCIIAPAETRRLLSRPESPLSG